MSVSSVQSLTGRLEKVKAFEAFALHDDEARPLASSSTSGDQELRLSPGSAIIVTGYVPCNAIRYAVDLTCTKLSAGTVALHFNPRLERDYVVRNSCIRHRWHTEETCSPFGRPTTFFRRNAYFHLMIFCTLNEFQIAVDGEHFCSFAYRLPLEDVNGIEVHGDVEEVRTRVTKLDVYPDPKICRSIHNLELLRDKPLRDNLHVPATVSIPEGVEVGNRILIKGRLKLLPHSFYVNLQSGSTIYPHPEIGLHLNPRFLFGSAEPCVVMNCWRDGQWDHEERHEGVRNWGPGREFLLTLSCEYDAFTIWLGEKMIGEFRHRADLRSMNTLRICGDVILFELDISSTPRSSE